MMKKLGFWIAPIIVLGSVVAILANPAGNQVARTDRMVIKVQRSSFLDPFMIPQATYVIATDGAGEISEELPPRLGEEAEWSPDGQWIVYRTPNTFWNATALPDIDLMRSDGRFRTRLTHHQAGGSYDPAWSADGTKIAYFVYDNSGSDHGIYVLNIGCLLQGEKCSPVPRFLAAGQSPDWSPDGQFIVYQPLYPENGIQIIQADGAGTPIELPQLEGKICSDPRWSPDGTKIAASCFDKQSDSSQIFIVNLDGSQAGMLTEGAMPSWSPDGSKIAFTSERDGLGKCISGTCGSGGIYSNAIFLMNPDGSGIVRLSPREDESVLWYAWVR